MVEKIDVPDLNGKVFMELDDFEIKRIAALAKFMEEVPEGVAQSTPSGGKVLNVRKVALATYTKMRFGL